MFFISLNVCVSWVGVPFLALSIPFSTTVAKNVSMDLLGDLV